MSLIRPEAAAFIARWNEALIGGAVTALGLYWGFFSGGLLQYIGYIVAACGAALIVTGLQRGRFRQGGGGPGVVQVNEGRVVYFGPLNGGLIDLADLQSLSLDATARPPHWELLQPGIEPLQIPITAKGADALFDAFATLPGIRTEWMLQQMQSATVHRVVIWRKGPTAPRSNRLH
ncbi:MAG: hypothetical protein MK160_05965 [Rhodobacteraceae bacterium]|nr:hypothetical protein [Paracoccaceae bacterium]